LTFQNDNSTGGLVPLLCRHRPAAVWLFAQAARQHAVLISDLKSVGKSWGLKVFVQVGSIQSAVEAVQDGADILVVQGSDAGGHQFRNNASIMTLLPEILDVLRKEMRHQKIPVLAAGGITDGRGLAAALALGMCFSLLQAIVD
jgi:nitronate monooxygenase